jgi:hypothetical protein
VTDIAPVLTELLASLGDTPDSVADHLRSLDIKGKSTSACLCPIANYIRSQGFGGVSVNHMTVVVNIAGSGIRPPIEVRTPRPVRAFIQRFDDGVYLDLEELPEVAE